jgi:hypothetical protein
MIDEELTSEQLRSFLKLDIRVGRELAYPREIIYDGPQGIVWSNPSQIFFIEYSEEEHTGALERLEWIRMLRSQ